MANEEHLEILNQGVEVWNEWREKNKNMKPDLSRARLMEASLNDANLTDAFLGGADLIRADLVGANLTNANLQRTSLRYANLTGADLTGTDLTDADLNSADLYGACFIGANLTNAHLSRATLVHTDFSSANLSGCHVYGISIWNAKLKDTIQNDLLIMEYNKPSITVDNIEIAQFIHLLVHNEKLRQVIDTITGKAVLILGRFTDDRKPVLDAIREELRKRNYIPILFDFEKPSNRDLTETMSTLAHLARFIVADLTDAKSIPLELKAVVPNLPSVAVQPIILRGQRPFSMYEHIERFQSVLAIYEYDTQEQVIAELVDKIIVPAEEKVKELRPKPLG